MTRFRYRCGDVCSWNERSCGNRLSLQMDSLSATLGASRPSRWPTITQAGCGH